MKNRNIPFSCADIQDSDLEAVNSVIRSGWLAHGRYSEELENLFCKFTGSKYATTVSNCTAGLHLSCLASGFGINDEVIVPAQTHTATAHAIEYTQARPIFIDVDSISGNMLVIQKDGVTNVDGSQKWCHPLVRLPYTESIEMMQNEVDVATPPDFCRLKPIEE